MPYKDVFKPVIHSISEWNEYDGGPANVPDERVCVGQVRTDRRNKPETAFTVMRLYIRKYPDGSSRYRVYGFLSTGYDGISSHRRSLDLSSMFRMFPHVKFDLESYENRQRY